MKRVAEKQITKDDGDDSGEEEPQGEMKKASAEVLAKRRILKAKRTTKPEGESSPKAGGNMFGGMMAATAAPAAEGAKSPKSPGSKSPKGEEKPKSLFAGLDFGQAVKPGKEGEKNPFAGISFGAPAGGATNLFASLAGSAPTNFPGDAEKDKDGKMVLPKGSLFGGEGSPKKGGSIFGAFGDSKDLFKPFGSESFANPTPAGFGSSIFSNVSKSPEKKGDDEKEEKDADDKSVEGDHMPPEPEEELPKTLCGEEEDEVILSFTDVKLFKLNQKNAKDNAAAAAVTTAPTAVFGATNSSLATSGSVSPSKRGASPAKDGSGSPRKGSVSPKKGDASPKKAESNGSPAKEAPAASSSPQWKWEERGMGLVHVNKHKQKKTARLIMRMKGVLSILLNSPMEATTNFEKVGSKSVKFMAVDADEAGATKLSLYRVNLNSSENQTKFFDEMTKLATEAKP